MGAVLILAPVIVSSWPAIAAAAVGAASALGLAVGHATRQALREDNVQETEENVELELSDSEVLAEQLATDQTLVLTKGSVKITVGRDARGRCKVCASGMGHTKAELEQMAQQFTEKLTQCFIYDKVVKELKSKSFQVVNEEVMQDESIRIHVRRWVD
jgi:hypothetical protein